MLLQEPCEPILREDLLCAYLRLFSRCPPKVTGMGDIDPGALLPIWMVLVLLLSLTGMALVVEALAQEREIGRIYYFQN